MYSKIISGALSSLVSAELIPVRARQKERLDIIVTMYAAIVAPARDQLYVFSQNTRGKPEAGKEGFRIRDSRRRR